MSAVEGITKPIWCDWCREHPERGYSPEHSAITNSFISSTVAIQGDLVHLHEVRIEDRVAPTALEAGEAEIARLRGEIGNRKGQEDREITRLATERDALTQQIDAVKALVAKWRADVLTYPTTTDINALYAQKAVELCTNELDAILSTTEEES